MGLDFLNSIAVPVDTTVEWLATGEDLLAWLRLAKLVPDPVLRAFPKKSLPGQLDALAAQARALRDWFKPFVYKHMGRAIEANALRELEPLNQLLARDQEFGQIVIRESASASEGEQDPAPSALAWISRRRWDAAESLLLPIAHSLADLVCNEDFRYVRACEGPECTLLFVDHTRGRARRWCSMAICGNRAKQAAHRQRLQLGRRYS
jgi:predicted RNA-binding Zn ribbon-like protein